MKRRDLAVAIGVVLLSVVVVFAPGRNNAFISWDDGDNWTGNAFIRGFSAEQLRGMWTDSRLGVWQPLSWFAAAVQYKFGGGSDAVALSRTVHIVNIGLHAVASVLCLFLMRRLIAAACAGRDWATPRGQLIAATIATLFFAIHPLRVECVSWASAQPYILALIFCIATLIAYMRAAGGSPASYMLALVFYALALLSKATAVPLVGVLFVLDFYPLRRFGDGLNTRRVARLLVEKIPFVALACIAAGVAVWATVSTKTYASQPPLQKCLVAAHCVMFYPIMTLCPINLSPQYAEPLPFRAGDPQFMYALPAFLLVTIILIMCRRRYPSLLAAWIAMVICLSPNLGLVRHGGQMAADRYTYLSCLGFAAIVGAAAARAICSSKLPSMVRAAGGLFAAIAICLLGWLASQHVGVYKDSVSAWTRMVERNPRWPMGPYNLAMAWKNERHDIAEAKRCYEHVFKIDPDYPAAHVNLGNILMAEGDANAALTHYQAALRRKPTFHMAHWRIAAILSSRRQYAEAVRHLEIAAADARRTPGCRYVAEIERDLARNRAAAGK